MSYSGNVKSELCRREVEKNCCALAETLGVLLFCNTFNAKGIKIVTENRDFSIRLPRLFHKSVGIEFDQKPEPGASGKMVYAVTDEKKLHTIFEKCGFSASTSVSVHVNRALLEKDCCKAAFIRGAFLAGGSVTDPEKRYHLELSTIHQNASRETENLLLDMNLQPKVTERKSNSIIYFKQSETIEEFLTLIGAPVSAMGVMQAKIEKDWRNEANRKVNCDSANLDKVVEAAQLQIAAIQKLKESGIYETLPDKIKETAELRLLYPEMTLNQLAEEHKPPVSKSAINHRLRKLTSLVEDTSQAQ